MRRSDEFVDLSTKKEEENVKKSTLTENEVLAIKEIKRIIKTLNKGKKTRAWQHMVLQKCQQEEKLSDKLVSKVLRKRAGLDWDVKIKKRPNGDKSKWFKLKTS